MCETMIPRSLDLLGQRENEQIYKKGTNTPYKSDADMSEEEIIQGLMEISAACLTDEPHKYYRSR